MDVEIGGDKTFTHVRLVQDGPLAVLTLNRPEKLNALSLAMHRAIFRALAHVRAAPSIRALVLTGTGRAFCAGDDMNESDPRTGSVPPEAETEIAWHNMVRQMRSLPKPVIAAVNGVACGAGGGLLLGADIRIASDKASFADIFTRRGIAGGAYLLTQAVGASKALELIFSGAFIDANEAERLGIFNRVVKHDALMAEALALGRTYAAGPAEAFGLSKLAVYQCAQLALDEGLRTEELAKLTSLRGAGVREGISAFNDKRQADFIGKA
jgi:2-(1,2-epoxy-1,2-dihydrophenyl)acetyl-CoA isomerase